MKQVSIKATPIIARDLQPGDLFSTANQRYWDRSMSDKGVGEGIYVRTNLPTNNADDADTPLFKLEIQTQEV